MPGPSVSGVGLEGGTSTKVIGPGGPGPSTAVVVSCGGWWWWGTGRVWSGGLPCTLLGPEATRRCPLLLWGWVLLSLHLGGGVWCLFCG